MKLNNKGTTLAELLVSIALLSVVLVFMFRLLVDINNEQNNDTFANNNQVVRAEVIRYIENDLNNKTLSNISRKENNKNELTINFHYTDGESTVIVAKTNEITITNSVGETRRWTFKDCSLYPSKALAYYKLDDNIVSININIEIHTNNDLNTVGNNNTLDDISISYIGDGKSFINDENLECLGYCCKHNCN